MYVVCTSVVLYVVCDQRLQFRMHACMYACKRHGNSVAASLSARKILREMFNRVYTNVLHILPVTPMSAVYRVFLVLIN